MILGQTFQGQPGFNFGNVGIGTDTPRSTLEAAVNATNGLGPTLTLTNSGTGSNTAASVDFNTYLPSTSGAVDQNVQAGRRGEALSASVK